MSEAQVPSAEPSDVLAREGAHWFARMRGPGAETMRPEFEAWLARGAAHRTAYNRAAEIFAMGKLLAHDASSGTPAPSRVRIKGLAVAVVVSSLSVLAAGGWIMMRPDAPTALPPGVAAGEKGRTEMLATLPGEARTVRLADGSLVALGSDSAVLVEFDPAGRRLRLRRGHARFEVAHERRPFVVLAGGGSVTARGTVFEVKLTPGGRVGVRLLEGAVDVALPRGRRAASVVRHLRPGERIGFDATAAPTSPTARAPGPVTMREYRSVTLAALVAEANRGARRPIRLADRTLAEKRVSGRFRTDDTTLLARRLAALFDGRADLAGEREILLSR